jgi:hypothetical protein
MDALGSIFKAQLSKITCYYDRSRSFEKWPAPRKGDGTPEIAEKISGIWGIDSWVQKY